MKIKLSRSQWEEMGKRAGWKKVYAQVFNESDEDLHRACIDAFKSIIKDMYPGDMREKLPIIDSLVERLQNKINSSDPTIAGDDNVQQSLDSLRQIGIR